MRQVLGGFLLHKDAKDKSHLIKNAISVFEKKKLTLNKKISVGNYTISVFYKRSHQLENIYYLNENNFLISVGTFLYKRVSGLQAYKQFFSDFINDKVNFSMISGHYCIILNFNGKLVIFNDYEGIYHVFTNKDKTVISNSFIALCKATSKRTLSKQEVYEYLFYGTTYGNKTIFKEIELLNSKIILELPINGENIISLNKETISTQEELNSDFNFFVSKVSKHVLDFFQILKENYSNNISLGLSGGFDSRLMLAALLANDIKPKVYVSGGESSKDYQISKLIAKNEQLEFKNYRENEMPKLDKNEYKFFIHNKFYNLDALGYAGVFGSILDMDLQNSTAAVLNINGGAGEIYRNLWFFDDRNVSLNNFIKSIYDNQNLNIYTQEFDKTLFFETFKRKIKLILNKQEEILSSYEIQSLYPKLELSFFAGKTVSILNQYSYALLPLSNISFVNESITIPLKYKIAGLFEAELIKKINPNIAKYPSVYGYNFFDKISLKNKLYDIFLIKTPFVIRPILRKIKSKKGILAKPYYLNDSYLAEIFDKKEYYMNKYVNISSIQDQQTLSRALTLEYLQNNI